MARAKQIISEVESLDEQGRGILRVGEQRLALFGTIPGESIAYQPEIRPSSGKKSWKILKPSPDRREPPCPYFGECGGCQLQHMNEARQLLEKEHWLRALFRGELPDDCVYPVIASPKALHYRRRVQFQISPQAQVGFFAEGSHQVVPVESCAIAQEEINRKIPELRKMASELLQARERPSLLQLEVTVDEWGRAVVDPNGEERNFIQVNPEANQSLLEFLKKTFAELAPRRVLELYAGEGNLSFALAEGIQHWTAVESSAPAVGLARAEAMRRGLTMEWLEGDASANFKKCSAREGAWDLLLLDPPRQGAEAVMEILGHSSISKLLYVSCNPLTLKRDWRRLKAFGFKLRFLQPLDFFPQTMHLETVLFAERSDLKS